MLVPEPVATVRLKVVPSPFVKVTTLLDTDAVYRFAVAKEDVLANELLIAFAT